LFLWDCKRVKSGDESRSIEDKHFHVLITIRFTVAPNMKAV
jgi:hypothetical protein